MKRHVLVTLVVLAAAGCSDTDTTTTQSTEPDPTPQVTTDPIPETGTGGEQQNAAPDGTVTVLRGQHQWTTRALQQTEGAILHVHD
jgi:hypothetical protein